MAHDVFGTLGDGTEIAAVTLKKGRLEARVITYGAIIADLKLDGRSIVLGFDNLESYLTHSPYFGAVPGRYANRINEGRFSIDGEAFQVTKNQQNTHHLHGGAKGFGKSVWTIEQSDKSSVLLKYVSADGEEGYPGQVEALCRYTLTGANALRVRLTATTDRPTLVNLTQHSYFNLDGGPDILDHTVEVAAERYLPVNAELIPTGEMRNVEWTPYDFQDGRNVRRKSGEENVIFDHNFCLAEQPRSELSFAAAVEGAESDTRMELWTTEPGVQFYDGKKVDVSVPGLNGTQYGPHAGLCLEPQRWPDSPNHDTFTDSILRPGETYVHVSEFRFS
ncbi:MAG: aldose epimerase family protein [Stappiaceae bacterium]